MSQKYTNNFSYNVLQKLKEADILIIKEYELFLSGKNSFYNSKIKLLNEINQYYKDLIEAFETEQIKHLNLIQNYFKNVDKEFNEIDKLLQKNKNIINKGINYMNILMKQNFMEVKIIDQLELIEELNLNSLLDSNINNRINILLFQIKNNLLIPKINIDKKVLELVHEINDSFSIQFNNKFNMDKLNNINNVVEETEKNKCNSVASLFLNDNSIYLEEEQNELTKVIDELCFYLNKLELSPNFIWFEPNSCNIYEISFNNKENYNKINYNYIGNNIYNSYFFNEEFNVSNNKNNLMFVTGGKLENNQIINDVYEYSLIEKTLIQKTPMQQNRINHGSIIIDNNLYICGGIDENFNILDSCEKYEIEENKWEFISPMKEQISKFNLVQIDNKSFAIFGGIKKDNSYNYCIHFYRTDINTWFILNNFKLPYGLIYPGLCNISSKFIFICGGINENNQESKEIFKMDIENGSLQKINSCLDICGFCTYQALYSKKEIHLLINHKGQTQPERVIFHL